MLNGFSLPVATGLHPTELTALNFTDFNQVKFAQFVTRELRDIHVGRFKRRGTDNKNSNFMPDPQLLDQTHKSFKQVTGKNHL